MKRIFAVIVLLGVLGCGQGVSVKGKITFPDGQPLTTGEVIFQTETRMVSGRIQSDGTYKLSGATENDGVPPGRYGVRIAAYEPVSAPSGTMPGEVATPPPIPLIDAKFEKTTTSGLICDVKGAMIFNITVTKPEAPGAQPPAP